MSNDELDEAASELWCDKLRNRDRLVLHYMPFAHKISAIGRRRNRLVSLEEYESAAYMGLIEAIDRYDPASGAAFTTFAFLRVQGAVNDATRDNDWVPHTARSADKEHGRIPAMVPLIDDADLVAHVDVSRIELDLELLSECVELESHRQMIRDVLSVGMEEARRLAGCSEGQFARVMQWAVKRAKERAELN